MQSSLMGDHAILGWAAFTLCLPPYLYIAMHIETLDYFHQPATDSSRILNQPRLHWFAVATAAAITAIIGPIWFASIKPHIAHDNLATALNDSQSTLIEYAKQPTWKPAYKKMDEHLVLQFPGKFPEMQIHIVTYFSQGQGKELIQWGNNISDNRKWRLRSEQSISSPEGDPLKLASLQSMTGNAEVIYWYAIGDYTTNSELKAKGYQLLAFLWGREDASLLAIFYPCAGGNCTQTRASAVEAVTNIKRLYVDAMKRLTGVNQLPDHNN
jgi:EpsI family protein